MRTPFSLLRLRYGTILPRMIALTVLPVLVVAVLTALVLQYVSRDLQALRTDKAMTALEMSLSIIDHYEMQAGKGVLSELAAQKSALNAIRQLRYDDGAGYITVTNDDFYNIMHPTMLALEGNFVKGFQTVDGRFIVQEATELGKREGTGVLEYPFENSATGFIETKTAAIGRFDPWGWTLFAGVFDEPFRAALGDLRQSIMAVALAGCAILLGAALLLGRSLVRAIRLLTERMHALAGGDLDGPIPFIGRLDELGGAARALAQFRDNARQLRGIEGALREALQTERKASDALAERIADKSEGLEEAMLALDKARREADWLATHDELTGVLNRRGLFRELQRTADLVQQEGHLEIAAIDLDGFSKVNDTLGHEIGDSVLECVTDILRANAGPDAIVARTGGDEFAVARTGAPQLAEICGYIVGDLQQPIRVRDHEVRIGASAGIAAVGPEGCTVADLMIRADVALQEAKRRGKAQVASFDAALHDRTRKVRTLADEIARGLERDEFVPYFQSQRCARSGALVGVEALVRWQHPRLGLLPPGAFLDVAETAGRVEAIDRQLMWQACAAMRDLEAQGLSLPGMSVNVSLQRLSDPRFLTSLKDLPKMQARLTLEIVEAVFFDGLDDQIIWSIESARENGALLEVDDFGTGHASITALTRLRPDGVKIDRELVRPSVQTAEGSALLASVVQMGKALGMHIVAEGVETAEQVGMLRELGVDALQGYYFDAPMSLNDLRRCMRAEAA